MANPIVVHSVVTNAATNPDVLVDGPAWDAAHVVTGLENVDNTSDADKPISTAVQAALDLKADDANLAAHLADTANPHSVTATQVGLGNVNNTSDAGKPVSTATQTALDLKANLASPTFTGTPAGPTAAVGTNTTQLATTAFVLANSGGSVARIFKYQNFI